MFPVWLYEVLVAVMLGCMRFPGRHPALPRGRALCECFAGLLLCIPALCVSGGEERTGDRGTHAVRIPRPQVSSQEETPLLGGYTRRGGDHLPLTAAP